MAVTALRWAYRRLGRHYPRVFLVLELQTVYPVILGTYALFSFYYDGDAGDFFTLFGLTCGLAAIAIVVACLRTFPMLRPLEAWIAGARDDRSTTEAWAAAISFPWRMIRSNVFVPATIVIIPSAVLSVVMLDLSWTAVFPFIVGSTVALAYASMLHYFALEIGYRPLLIDINQQVSPRTEANLNTVSLRWRLLLTLPMINAITGVTVAALTAQGGGGESLGLDVGIALGVATTIALELTLLVTRSVLRPIADLQQATERVLDGDFSVSVPVTTGDETGELAASFNAMVQGLAEREKIREAFGTYLDREVAEYILSDGFTEEGIELEVSVLFTDVRDFTGFAAEAEAKEVVAALNDLFEVVVPIIARHGGHVDKFEGDGLLAVFGAPRPYQDHARRATRAALEICRRVNEEGEDGDLRVGVGVNTGRVVAGAIGGGGRLNFSVIGDAVNVAARAEAATRELDRDVLITSATAESLGPGIEVESEGSHSLKGVADPVELFSVRSSLASRVDGDKEVSMLDPEPLLAVAGKVRRSIFRRPSR
ncbi:MAG TPA: adenylate/guanylate cyclase domain-containing protein [Solirubrobacterales bacterium]|nr:adenylate/guanylate cyclase domain-containing protein [Solirubrobacterales bacterium]